MEILNWKFIKKNSCVATFSLKIPKWGGFIIRDCSYFEKDSAHWVSLPSRAYEEDGKKKYFSYVAFEDPKMMKDFLDKALKAVDVYILNLSNQKNEKT